MLSLTDIKKMEAICVNPGNIVYIPPAGIFTRDGGSLYSGRQTDIKYSSPASYPPSPPTIHPLPPTPPPPVYLT